MSGASSSTSVGSYAPIFIVLTHEDCARLGADVPREILSKVGPAPMSTFRAAGTGPQRAEALNFTGVVDLTSEHVDAFMSGIKKQETRAGLRVFAEHGPIVEARLLNIPNNNYSHFQAQLTKRIRLVTGSENALLLTWDLDWQRKAPGTWRYAVTNVTHQSLRKYFGVFG